MGWYDGCLVQCGLWMAGSWGVVARAGDGMSGLQPWKVVSVDCVGCGRTVGCRGDGLESFTLLSVFPSCHVGKEESCSVGPRCFGHHI